MQARNLPFSSYTETVRIRNVLRMAAEDRTIDGIRLANARALLDSECDGVVAAFARRIGRSDSQANHLVGPNPKKPIGKNIARLIEEKFGKPAGWLDREHSDDDFSDAARWVARAFDKLGRPQQENFVLMLRGHLEQIAPNMLASAPIYHRKSSAGEVEENAGEASVS